MSRPPHPLTLFWDDDVTRYDFGPGHPMDPVRLALTMSLVRAFGLDRLPGVTVRSAPAAGDSTLALVHDPGYIAAVRRVAETGLPDLERGLGTEDNPAFAAMHEASALIAGQSVAGAEAAWGGSQEVRRGAPRSRAAAGGGRAVNFAGGLHHAMAGKAWGFCVYNDAALAVARLLELGAERVAYVDVDVHHGDGVQQAFWNDPRVLTISLHEHPRTLFPQTGWAEETGGPAAEGTAVNLPLPAGTGDAGWLRAFHAVVPELLAAFRPQVLVSQHGADTHLEDPLAHLAVSLDAQRVVAEALAGYADEYAEGRWLALGGGGYAVADVVPRTWTHLVAIAAGRPIPPEQETPEDWRADVMRLARQHAPLRMTDGMPAGWKDFDGGYDPADRLDQAVLATRRAVFPHHGLLP
ncbi:acetoin utilization protein AcuC [Streptacidiphilus carbonis]|uniref:acetoin utilization protein AcuC n=1 Tax=Streptacidiphilus carbonis TaxID=105422 RepID=UPI0005AA6415|nr:acetoin utilization protein AcuC [Streptacidiphilus carbonis]